MASLEDLIGAEEEDLAVLKSQRDAALARTLETGQAPVSGNEAGLAAALGILPILIGAAVKGKKGANVGAQAGTLGAVSYLKGVGDKQEQERETAQLLYKSFENQIRAAEKGISGLERDQARFDMERPYKDAYLDIARQNVARGGEGGTALSPEQADSLNKQLLELGVDYPVETKEDAKFALQLLSNKFRARETDTMEKGEDRRQSDAAASLLNQKLSKIPDATIRKTAEFKAARTRLVKGAKQLASLGSKYSRVELDAMSRVPDSEYNSLLKEMAADASVVRNSIESGVATDADQARFQNLLTPGLLGDPMKAAERILGVVAWGDNMIKHTITLYKANNADTTGMEKVLGLKVADPFSGTAKRNARTVEEARDALEDGLE